MFRWSGGVFSASFILLALAPSASHAIDQDMQNACRQLQQVISQSASIIASADLDPAMRANYEQILAGYQANCGAATGAMPAMPAPQKKSAAATAPTTAPAKGHYESPENGKIGPAPQATPPSGSAPCGEMMCWDDKKHGCVDASIVNNRPVCTVEK